MAARLSLRALEMKEAICPTQAQTDTSPACALTQTNIDIVVGIPLELVSYFACFLVGCYRKNACSSVMHKTAELLSCLLAEVSLLSRSMWSCVDSLVRGLLFKFSLA